MDELDKNQIIELTGPSGSELDSMIQTEFGEKYAVFSTVGRSYSTIT